MKITEAEGQINSDEPATDAIHKRANGRTKF
jgi:hypothetical protein